MPWAPRKPCRVNGCPNLTDGSRCETHLKQERRDYDKARQGDPYRKIYSSRRWRSVRALHLQEEPLCRECRADGKYVPGVIVDHVVPMKQGGDAWDPENHQSLCASCHSAKSIREGSRYGSVKSDEDVERRYTIA